VWLGEFVLSVFAVKSVILDQPVDYTGIHLTKTTSIVMHALIFFLRVIDKVATHKLSGGMFQL
jgi:hypothetical protein